MYCRLIPFLKLISKIAFLYEYKSVERDDGNAFKLYKIYVKFHE